MAEKRSVGRPNNNPGRMEYRDVPVQKDSARINDQRKVHPHDAGSPPMGIRPRHPGAQKEPKAPSDKLAGNYIQARDVPMAKMTEAELAEWNPFGMFSRPQAQSNQNDLDGKVSRLERQVDVLQQQLWRMGRQMAGKDQPAMTPAPAPTPNRPTNANPMRRPAMTPTPTPNGPTNANPMRRPAMTPTPNPKMTSPGDFSIEREPSGPVAGPMGRSVPSWKQGPGAPSPRPRSATPMPPAASSFSGGMPFMIPAAMKQKLADLGYTSQEIRNLRPQEALDIINGKPYGRRVARDTNHFDDGSRAAPAATPGPENNVVPMQNRMPLASVPLDKIDEILAGANSAGMDKGFWTPQRIQASSELNKRQAADKFLRSKHTHAGGVIEGYPDKNYERHEPAHSSRIGDLRWKGRQKPAGMPALNRGYIQARDVPVANIHEGYPNTDFEWCEPAHPTRGGEINWNHQAKSPQWPELNRKFAQPLDLPVEKVTETAEHDMDNMITRTIKRLGLSEDMSTDPSAAGNPHADPVGPQQPNLPGMGGPAAHAGPETDHVTLPAEWASALVNGDFSGLDDHEADQARMTMHRLATDGWDVVDIARDEQTGEGHEPRFTWQYQVHAPESPYRGGNVVDYVIHRRPAHHMESKLPRVRARW